MTNYIRVITLIHDSGTSPELVSPNYIASIAVELGIILKSNEIIEISDNFVR